MNEIATTNEWDLYQKGIEYKQRIGLYRTVEENHRMFQGDQWHGFEDDGLPTPVFNVIKPVIRYKISTIMQNDTKIIYRAGNTDHPMYTQLEEVTRALTKYAESLWETLKMDFRNENLLKDAAITGDGTSYFYYDESEQQIKIDLIDSTNVYPSDVNDPDIQSQDWIIISFRRPVESVRREATKAGVSEELIDTITSDTDTQEQAGAMAKIELDDYSKCVVLLKLWRDDETGTIHFRKSTKNVVIAEDEDTGLKLYPIAHFNWETVKNSFHGSSDVTGLIPNQLYINKIASMIMLSTMYTAFPKMVYDDTLVENPDNQIGVAIGVNASGAKITDLIDYITPASISGDAFGMFERTISLTQELMGAGDGALGNIDPEKASGRSILAVMEQSALPLESIRRRYFNFIEDVAKIWADLWRVNSKEGMTISFTNDDGEQETGIITADMFEQMLILTKIDIGPSSRWNERALAETLDNLLQQKYIPFEWYVDLMPDSSGLPKDKLKELMQQAQEEQMAQQQMQQQMLPPSDDEIDALLDSLPPEVQQQALQDPSILQEVIAQQNM